MHFSINGTESKMAVSAALLGLALLFCMPASHAGLLASVTNAAQAGTGANTFLGRTTEKLGGILSCAVKGDDDGLCMKRADELISKAQGQVIVDSSLALRTLNSIAKRRISLEKVKRLKRGFDKGFADTRSLVIGKAGSVADGWSESSALRLDRPIRKLKTAFVRKPPTVRSESHSGSAGETPAPELSLSSGEPKEWKGYRKYHREAVANWERNATDKQKSFRKTTGAGPEVMNFHEYLQRQESGGAYSDAVAGGYASALGGLDEKEEEQRAIRQQAWQNIAESLNSFNRQMQDAYSSGGSYIGAGSGSHTESGKFDYCVDSSGRRVNHSSCRQ